MSDLILTVSLPNYNHATYLSTRIPSLLASMPSNSELLIVDDGSTDNSVEILERLAQEDDRIVLYRKEKNEGVTKALNLILSKARGQYISFQSADDINFPDCFSKLLEVTKQHPGLGIYTSNYGYFNPEKGQSATNFQSIPLLDVLPTTLKIFPKETIAKELSKTRFWIPGHASLVDRKLINLVGPFEPSLAYLADYFLINAVALLGGVAYLPETLALFRMDNNSYSAKLGENRKKEVQARLNYYKVLRSHHLPELRELFRNSGLLSGNTRRCLWQLLFRVIDVDFIIYSAIRFFRIRLKKQTS